MTAAADRHLLFGLLALQNGLIDQGALVAPFQAWTRDKARSSADQLVARVNSTPTPAPASKRSSPFTSRSTATWSTAWPPSQPTGRRVPA